MASPAKKAKTAAAKRTILVTGGQGLVGHGIQSVVKDSDDKWIFLSRKDGDLTDMAATRAIFEKHKPTHVIHLAAAVGGLFANMRQNVEFFRTNSAMNDTILYCCHEFKVQKLISCLSTCIFPDKTTYPIDETMLHNGPPHDSNLGYSTAKRDLDVLSRLYHRQHGCKFTTIIPTNVFGEYDNFSTASSHVIPALIEKVFKAKESNTDFVVWGSGKPMRQFIYAKDLAKIFVWALHNYDEPEPFIASVDPADEVSIADIARAVAKAAKFTGKIVFDTSKSDGQFKKTANNSKFQKMWKASHNGESFQFTPLEEALKNSVEWYEKNQDIVRR